MMNTTKIHYVHVKTVAEALHAIFRDGHYADRVIERALKSNPKMGSRDRAFIAETTYDVVRWWRLLNASVETTYGHDESHLLNILSAYFLLFKHIKIAWRENDGIDFNHIEANYQEAIKNPAIRYSLPDWLYELLKSEHIDVDTELEALNREAAVVLRVNTLKTTIDQLAIDLQSSGIDTSRVEMAPNALVLSKRQNLVRNEYYLQGLFEIQDAGSQCIADYLDVGPGMSVIDACAGAGGKTLAIAAHMNNEGRILSLDIEKKKLDELMRRSNRAGAAIVASQPIESPQTIEQLQGSADRVLLDVPCSGLGTLRRSPDSKWKLTEAFMNDIKAKQQKILQTYAQMVKPGGKLVYATCSILPSENQDQVHYFLANNPNFSLEQEKTLLPSQSGFDGFYMARLARLR